MLHMIKLEFNLDSYQHFQMHFSIDYYIGQSIHFMRLIHVHNFQIDKTILNFHLPYHHFNYHRNFEYFGLLVNHLFKQIIINSVIDQFFD